MPRSAIKTAISRVLLFFCMIAPNSYNSHSICLCHFHYIFFYIVFAIFSRKIDRFLPGSNDPNAKFESFLIEGYGTFESKLP